MFHNVRLPEHIERGAEGGPRFKTSVIILSSGKEQRNVEWERSRAEWDIGYSVQTKEHYSEILEFFYNRRGRAYGFRFKDWSDFEALDTEIGTITHLPKEVETDPVEYETLTFQLSKTYQGFGTPYVRIITKPIEDTLVVRVNGAIVQVNELTSDGQVTINSPGTPYPDGAIVTASFEFDVPVRFDVDDLRINLEWLDLGDISGINIVEIK